MKLVTRQDLANKAAKRWKSIYYVGGKWTTFADNAEAVYERLVALGDSPNPDQVSEIAGEGFVSILCDHCQERTNAAISFKSVTMHMVFICRPCAMQMVGLFADGDGEE